MTALYVLLGPVVLLAFGIWLAVRSARKEGAAVERSDQSEKALDNVAKAKRARDRLWTDPAYRKRVRDEFTR